MKCPKCKSENILSTYEQITYNTINVNTGKLVEIVDGGSKLSEDVEDFYCGDCEEEWSQS